MRRPDIAVLGVLLAGNLLLWATYVAQDHGRAFDFEGFHTSVREALACDSLEPFRFDEDALLPEQYSYHQSTAEGHPLLSIYAGYYPRQGLLEGQPHAPSVCYRTAGWEVEAGPEAVRIVGDTGQELYASRLLVRHQDEERIVLFWLQQGGTMPHFADGRPGWLQELINRLFSRRSDRAWIRLELDPSQVSFPLEAEWQQRVRRTMAAVQRAMN